MLSDPAGRSRSASDRGPESSWGLPHVLAIGHHARCAPISKLVLISRLSQSGRPKTCRASRTGSSGSSGGRPDARSPRGSRTHFSLIIRRRCCLQAGGHLRQQQLDVPAGQVGGQSGKCRPAVDLLERDVLCHRREVRDRTLDVSEHEPGAAAAGRGPPVHVEPAGPGRPGRRVRLAGSCSTDSRHAAASAARPPPGHRPG